MYTVIKISVTKRKQHMAPTAHTLAGGSHNFDRLPLDYIV